MLTSCILRLVRTLFDLEFRRLDEIDLSFEQLLDVAQIAELVRRYQRNRRTR
jgi:predicted TIM-barrel fold metal-dependent hydrolase